MTTAAYYDDSSTLDYTGTMDYTEYEVLCEKAVANLQFRLWFMPVFYAITFVLGLVGNCLVIFTFLYFRRLKSMTDVYLLNLAFSDLLFALSLPFWAANAMAEWVLGLFMCKAMHTVYKVSFYSSMLLLSCISVDRYFAITKAVCMQRHRAKATFLSKLSSAIIWVLALVFSVPEMKYASVQVTCTPYSLTDSSLSMEVSIQSIQIAMGFVVPLLVMTFCYCAIAMKLWRSRSFERDRALKVILVVVVAFLFCHVPYTLVLFLSTLDASFGNSNNCSHEKALLFASDVTQYLAFLRCCINPFVYAFIGVKFRHDLLKLMREMGCITYDSFYKYSGRKSSVADTETTTTFSRA
ncbi:unnamed protein product [Merluccius merluccius]